MGSRNRLTPALSLLTILVVSACAGRDSSPSFSIAEGNQALRWIEQKVKVAAAGGIKIRAEAPWPPLIVFQGEKSKTRYLNGSLGQARLLKRCSAAEAQRLRFDAQTARRRTRGFVIFQHPEFRRSLMPECEL